MTDLQKLELKMSDLRKTLALAAPEPDTEAIEKLTNEIRQADSLLTAQRLIEPEPKTIVTTGTSEGREVLELWGKSSIGGFVQMMAAGRNEGAEAEFRAAVLGDGAQVNHLPIDMLMTQAEYRRFHTPAEVRAVTAVAAAAVTEANL